MTDIMYDNAVVSSQPLYLKDADKYELETSSPAPDNTDTQLDENPNSRTSTPSDDPTDWKKRYSDNQSWTSKIVKSKDEEIADLKAKLEAKERQRTYDVSDEELKAWEEQFPDYAKIQSARMQKMLDARLEEERKENDKLRQHVAQLTIKESLNELRKLHPDVDTLKSDPDFIEWFKKQPVKIQEILDKSPDYQEVASILDIYKQLSRKANQNNKRNASQAVNIQSKPETSTSGRIFKASEVNKMHWKTYERLLPEIDQARKEGRFDEHS